VRGKYNERHGLTSPNNLHPLYRIWQQMRWRCQRPGLRGYKNYGGRGIKVCERWELFSTFVEDVGPRPPGVGKGGRALYSLDRIDNDGDYESGNVKWSTMKEQGERTTTTILLTHAGCTRTTAGWAIVLGCSRRAIQYRLGRGWSISETLTIPFDGKKGKNKRAPCES
jgi:hypothetical protein